jgi:hypothetical protein
LGCQPDEACPFSIGVNGCQALSDLSIGLALMSIAGPRFSSGSAPRTPPRRMNGGPSGIKSLSESIDKYRLFGHRVENYAQSCPVVTQFEV